MTIQDKEIIQRALDIVEGAICIWLKTVRGMITTETEMIDEVLNKVVVAENATTTATVSKTERVRCAGCKLPSASKGWLLKRWLKED